MTDQRVRWGRIGGLTAVAGLAALLGAGCARPAMLSKEGSSMAPPPAYNQSIWTRSGALTEESERFSALANKLPGNSDLENRQLFERVFGQLTQVLWLLVGSDPAGPFEHQLSDVQLTRIRLAGNSPDLAVDPVIDNGLLATYNALVEVSAVSLYHEANVTEPLNQLKSKIAILDEAPGSAHAVVAAEAVQQIAGIVKTMAAALAAKVADPTAFPPPAAEPTVAVPSTAPASEPAAAPTTQPSEPGAPAAPATEPSATPPPTTEPGAAPATPATEPGAAPATPPAEPGTTPATAPAEPGAPAAPPADPGAAPATPPAEPAPTTPPADPGAVPAPAAPPATPDPGATPPAEPAPATPTPDPGAAPAPAAPAPGDAPAPPADAPPAPAAPPDPAPAPAPPEVNK